MAWLRKVPKNISIVDNLFLHEKKDQLETANACELGYFRGLIPFWN